MRTKKSAGLLVYRFVNSVPEFLLAHPGGPFWKNKDSGAWSIPKGEFKDDEEPLAAAIREFKEETGSDISGNFIPLTPRKQKSGKTIYAWAVKGDPDVSQVKSNTFPLEWPPKSGRFTEIPEIDRAEWFDAGTAKEKIVPGQRDFISECEELLKREL